MVDSPPQIFAIRSWFPLAETIRDNLWCLLKYASLASFKTFVPLRIAKIIRLCWAQIVFCAGHYFIKNLDLFPAHDASPNAPSLPFLLLPVQSRNILGIIVSMELFFVSNFDRTMLLSLPPSMYWPAAVGSGF